MRYVSLLLSLLCLLACRRQSAHDDPAPPAGPPEPAPTVVWDTWRAKFQSLGRSNYTLKGAEVRLAFDAEHMSSTVTLFSFPVGSTCTINDQAVTIQPDPKLVDARDGTKKLSFPFRAPSAAASAASTSTLSVDLLGTDAKLDLGLQFACTFPRFEPVRFTAPAISVRSDLEAFLRAVSKSGKRLPDESAQDEVPADRVRGVALFLNGGSPTLLGDPKSLSDIDWVVFAPDSKKAARSVHCSGYTRIGHFEMPIYNRTARVFDRRTGHLLQEKTLEPSSNCPRIAVTGMGGTSQSVSDEAVTTWSGALIPRAAAANNTKQRPGSPAPTRSSKQHASTAKPRG